MTWWHYLLLANVYLTLFFVFYAVFLRKETFFNLNRTYLVSSALLSFFIPLIQSSTIKNLFITKKVQQTIFEVGPSVMQRIAANTTPSHQLTMGQILCGIYVAGIVILAFRFIYQLAVINWVISQPRTETTYSFFNTIKLEERSIANDAINAHEAVHARQWHSADVLLLEAIMILNWFNPVVYLYRNAVKHIHEFIADRDAIKAGNNKAEYAMLLLSQTFVTPPYYLVNPFFNSSLLKLRILMLNKNKSRRVMLMKYGLSAPLFALMLVLSSATVNNSKTIQVINNTAQKVFLTPAAVISTAGKNVTETDQKDLEAVIKQNQQAGAMAVAVTTPGRLTNQPLTAVEQNAEYPGGIDAFYKFLAEGIRYPIEAREKKIEGKVFLTFVVEKDGRLSNISILRDPGEGLGEEAVRVIKQSPKWMPAIQNGAIVRSRYTIPFMFALTDDKATDNRKDTAVNIAARLKTSSAIPLHDRIADTSHMEAHFISNVKNQPQFLVLADARLSNVHLSPRITSADPRGVNAIKDKAAKGVFGEKTTTGIMRIITKHQPFYAPGDLNN